MTVNCEPKYYSDEDFDLLPWFVRHGFSIEKKVLERKCRQKNVDLYGFLERHKNLIDLVNPKEILVVRRECRSWLVEFLKSNGIWPVHHHGNPSPPWRYK